MPRRDVRLMEDIDRVWSAVVELLEVAAVPAGWRIQRILSGVQIVRGSLLKYGKTHTFQGQKPHARLAGRRRRQTYLMVPHYCLKIHQLGI